MTLFYLIYKNVSNFIKALFVTPPPYNREYFGGITRSSRAMEEAQYLVRKPWTRDKYENAKYHFTALHNLKKWHEQNIFEKLPAKSPKREQPRMFKYGKLPAHPAILDYEEVEMIKWTKYDEDNSIQGALGCMLWRRHST